ncbi:uncharacterized protein VTP21DRAFT_10294 [Calcarisporiella thermophila]|uniref:uncharacterized protein n=1 Tax=Calcarisporiella thermophila TaxID=911321 RepID=UPI003743278A
MTSISEHGSVQAAFQHLSESEKDPKTQEFDEASDLDGGGDEDIIDRTTFDQLLEMDDDDERDFSKSIVWDYFDQAQATFKDMDNSLEKKDLEALSRLGHFLKGSSAALGLTKVKASCEKIQHNGNLKDATGTTTIGEQEALQLVTNLLKQVKREYKQAEVYLRHFYQEA